MFEIEDLPRAREWAEMAKATVGSCYECKEKSRRMAACSNCLAILFATAMTEAKLGKEEFERVQRAGDWKDPSKTGEN